ncbi:MAG: hypothetical protein LBO72_09585 [Helicobacteraceae bacterium]|jgi:hypothetical protein|nr:hypothetical protein [Helicobacteraceae bacterium]
MKRTVQYVLSDFWELTLINSYGDRLPFTFNDNTNSAMSLLFSGSGSIKLTPNAEWTQKTAYSLFRNAVGERRLFIVPDGPVFFDDNGDEIPIGLDKLVGFASLAGWRDFEGDKRGYDFAAGFIDRIDGHIRDLPTLRKYEGEFFIDFCRAENDEIVREDLTALDSVFVALAGGNEPNYPLAEGA